MFGFLKKRSSEEVIKIKEEPKMVKNSKTEEVDFLTQSPILDFNQPSLDNSNILSEAEEQIDELTVKSPKELELESQIGKLVICLSEQLENPMVAVGVEIVYLTKNQLPMLSVYDIVKKETSIPLGIIFDYSEQKFDALNQMDPNARIALFFKRIGNDIVEKNNVPGIEVFAPPKWKEKVSEAIERINRGEWT